LGSTQKSRGPSVSKQEMGTGTHLKFFILGIHIEEP
jgi:hypothetical protein